MDIVQEIKKVASSSLLVKYQVSCFFSLTLDDSEGYCNQLGGQIFYGVQTDSFKFGEMYVKIKVRRELFFISIGFMRRNLLHSLCHLHHNFII